ncbi:MAG: restriction endonuclease subunit S [Clostridium sp.]|nr:restriction endonuclease subunit S [Clostridium sp.]
MQYKLDDIFIFIRNGANIKQGLVDGGYPITRIETIANSYIDMNKVGYAGINNLEKYKEYLLKDGDILMSHINSEKHLGKTAIYEENYIKLIHGMNLLCLRANKEKIIPKYMNYYFKTMNFKNNLSKITKKSVNQASFSVNDLKRIVVDIPEISVQARIVETLDKAQELINKRKVQIEDLEELVKSKFLKIIDGGRMNYGI